MTTVRMTTAISGYRNLEPWPAVGDTIDLPAHEAADLIVAGYAEEAHAHHEDPASAADDGPAAPADSDPPAEAPGAVDPPAVPAPATVKQARKRASKPKD